MMTDGESRHAWLLVLGRAPYDEVHKLQIELVELRRRDLIDDVLILVEHEPVITCGRRAERANIVASDERLQELGVAVREVERGGDVTYHGPGQVVGYPIVRLRDHLAGASDYMHRLEDTVAAVVESYGLSTSRRKDAIGVWVGDNKICALGVRVRRGITFHGLALNVDPDVTHWALIIPCGIRDGGVTSLAAELSDPPTLREVRNRLATQFAEGFGWDLEPAVPEDLLRLGQNAAEQEA